LIYKVYQTGNVGIGTTSPNTKLSVSGGAINFYDAPTTVNANDQLRFGGSATDVSVSFVGVNNKGNAARLTLKLSCGWCVYWQVQLGY